MGKYKKYKQGKYTIKENPNGDKVWFLNDKLHREDGTAIVLSNGYKSWYLNGKRLTESEFKSALFKKNLKEILDN